MHMYICICTYKYLSNSFNTKKISLKTTVYTPRSKAAVPLSPEATS